MDKKRAEKLKKICQSINEGDWGGERKDALTFLGTSDIPHIERWHSGCYALDEAIGGGWPKGRLVEVFGPESGGKSTICYHALAEFQRAYPDEDVALVDSEYTFDPQYAQVLGVKVDQLLVCQPESGDQALNVVRQLVGLGIKLIIVDSVAALVPKSELDGDIGDVGVAKQARLLSQTMRILTGEAGQQGATIIFTNQVREKIGVRFGEKTTTSGGRALRFYCSLRVDVRRIGSEKEKDVFVSNRVKATVKKSKVCVPYKVANFIITFGRGIDATAGLFDAAIEAEIIEKKGQSYIFDGSSLGRGKANCLKKFREEPDMQEDVKNRLNRLNTGNKKVVSPMLETAATEEQEPDNNDLETQDDAVEVKDV